MVDPTTHAGLKATNGSTAGLPKTTFQGEPRNGGTISGTLASGFLTGTQIVAPDGEVPVERLAIGLPVLTFNGDSRRIVRIGVAPCPATPGRHGPASPVMLRRDALADNVPNRDLRLTKESALFIDGAMIPVEFLVNHRTILWDDDARDLTIYHVELETPDVLLANGAPAESSCDDPANRAAGNGLGLPIGGPRLDATWMRLLERAGGQCVATTGDPDLYLRVDGRRLNAASRGDDWYRFGLAIRPAEVRIVSRSGVPQELGVSRDPRRLGVAVREIMALKGRMIRTIEADDPSLLGGFHALEADTGVRWTNGDAAVPAVLFDRFIGPLEVFLRLNGSSTYPADLRSRRVPAKTGDGEKRSLARLRPLGDRVATG